MRDLFFSFLLLAVLTCSGCASYYMGDYHMAGAARDLDAPAVYEDADIKVAIAIIRDSSFGLRITNKTLTPLRITWGNSSIVDGSGKELKLAYKLTAPGRSMDGPDQVSKLAPGDSFEAEVYPAGNAYTDEKGRQRIRPLYDNGPEHDSPYDLKDKKIGINLVAEVNDHARRYPLMLEVKPSMRWSF